jgi:3-oxoacyl-[acyl-carrier protein] reductase
MDLHDKVAVVTGGSRGIGRACCLALAAEGMDIAVNYVSNEPAAAEAVAEVEKLDRTARAYQADIASAADVEAMAAGVLADFGQVHVVVCNAGVYLDQGNKIDEYTEEQWDRNMAVNVKGAWLVTRAFVPAMRERREGKIILVSSCAGVVGAWTLGYCTAKAAQLGFTMSLARELMRDNITVNCVAPGGMIETDMHGDLTRMKENLLAKAREDGLDYIPLGQRPGAPGEIAQGVVFFARNDFATGEILKIAGGTCICP